MVDGLIIYVEVGHWLNNSDIFDANHVVIEEVPNVFFTGRSGCSGAEDDNVKASGQYIHVFQRSGVGLVVGWVMDDAIKVNG